jgi:hypothetical protein
MVMGFVVDFRTLISWHGGVVFLQGFCKEARVLSGVFVVSLWWMHGETW